MTYYICDLTAGTNVPMCQEYIENESGKIYDGGNGCDNNGDNFEYVFEFLYTQESRKEEN